MMGYSNLGLSQQSNESFRMINKNSAFYPNAYLIYLKNDLMFYQKPIKHQSIPNFDSTQRESFTKLYTISTLYSENLIVSKSDFISTFDTDQQNTVSDLYDYKFNPPYKNPVWAGIFSAIIPGSGKMYVGEWGDGISGLLLTSLFAFLAYDNFRNDHDTRAWIFTGIGAFFYAGNIYGSIAAAQIFNERINFEFENGLKLFLEKENYFLPEFDLCE
jgi:TM2 domain-containing membrane protein YozV